MQKCDVIDLIVGPLGTQGSVDTSCYLALEGAEFFAGELAVTRGVWTRGYSCIPFEIKMDPNDHDFMSPTGFSFALGIVLRLQPGSIVWFISFILLKRSANLLENE